MTVAVGRIPPLAETALADRGKSKPAGSGQHAPSLRDVLGRPELLPALTLGQWDLVLRQARAAELAARLAYLIGEHGWRDAIPPEVLRHLDAERLIADKLARDVERELRLVLEPLLLALVPVVVLKGAAYIIGELPPAKGRVFSDIDILVPRDGLALAERRLIAAGWRGEEKDAWDQHFYRRWMHQVPPLVHPERDSVVDLHFAIVPTRARRSVASDPLFAAARPSPKHPDTRILAPCDLVLHSAVHLFNEGEFHHGLRDLVDLDLLLRHFAALPDFWLQLVRRAEALGLGRPLYFALRYTSRLLSTPVPASAIAASRRFAPLAPALMDRLFEPALRPPHATARGAWARLAAFLLYGRGHWLRLPPYLLAPHLLRAFVRRGLAKLLPGRESTE